MTIRIESIALRELRALDLRHEAAQLQLMRPDPDLSREDEDEWLDRSTEAPFVQFPALAFRLVIEGAASTGDMLVAIEEARIGIAWGADADWLDLGGDVDLTTVNGGDAFAARLQAAVNGWFAGFASDADLVGVAEIAQRAGVAEATVHSWRRRHDDFPAPIVRLAAGPVWRWPDVEVWTRTLGRGRPRRA
jgi:hypothetical protein